METVEFLSFEDSILPKIYFSNILVESANIDLDTIFEEDTSQEYSDNISKNKNIYGKSKYSTLKPVNDIIGYVNQNNKEIKIDYTVMLNNGLVSTDFIENKLYFCFILAKNKEVIDLIKSGNYTFQELNNFVLSKKIEIKSFPLKQINKNLISSVSDGNKTFLKLDGVVKFYLTKKYKNLALFSFCGIILTSTSISDKNKILLNYNRFGPVNGESIFEDGVIPEGTNLILDINGNIWAGSYHEMKEDNFKPLANTDQNSKIVRDYLVNTVKSSGPILESSRFMKGAKHNPRNILEENAKNTLTIKKIFNIKKSFDVEEITQKLEKQISYIQENLEFNFGERDIYLQANVSEKFSMAKKIVEGTEVFYTIDGGRSITGMFGISKKNILLKNSKYSKLLTNLDQERLNMVCSLSGLKSVLITRIPESSAIDEQEVVFSRRFGSEPQNHVKFYSKQNKVREKQILYSSFGPEFTKSKNEKQFAFYSFNDFRTNSKIEKDFYYSIDTEIEDGYKIIIDKLYKNFRNSVNSVLEIIKILDNKKFIMNNEKESSFSLREIEKIEIGSLINLKRSAKISAQNTNVKTINNHIKNMLFYYETLSSFVFPRYIRSTTSDIENIYNILKINNSNPQRLGMFLEYMNRILNTISQMLNYELLEMDSLSIGLKNKKTNNKKRQNFYTSNIKSRLISDNIEKKTKVAFISDVDSKEDRIPGLPQIIFENSGIQSVLQFDGRLAPKKFIIDNTGIRVKNETSNSYYEITQVINNIYGNPKGNVYSSRGSSTSSEFGTDTINKLSLLESLSAIGIYPDSENELIESNTNINNRIGANQVFGSIGTKPPFINSDNQTFEKTEQDESILSLSNVLDFPQELSYVIYANLAQESNNKNKLNNSTRAREHILYNCLTAKIQYLDIFLDEDVKDSLAFKFKDLTQDAIQNLKNKNLICRVVENSNDKGNSKTFSDLKLEISNKYFLLVNDKSVRSSEINKETSRVQNDQNFKSNLINNNFDMFLNDLENTTVLNLKQEDEIDNNISSLVLSNVLLRQPIQASTYGTNFARLDIEGVPSTRMNKAKLDSSNPSVSNTSQNNTTVNNRSAVGSSERNLRTNVPINSPTRTSGY